MNQSHLSLDGLPFGLRPFLVGGGAATPIEAGVRLTLPASTAKAYGDAQVDDYGYRPPGDSALPRGKFLWRPPLQLSLRARFSPGAMLGTAGFGFWNNPFTPMGGIPALPRAVWFFYASPPSNMALAHGVPGSGWKAMCIDATCPAALAWAPLAPVVLVLNQIPAVYKWLWPRVQRSLCIAETLLDAPMSDWHEYQLHWQASGVTFQVDGNIVLQAGCAPRGPMGFVAWVDNQYAVVTPRGRFGWGLVDTPAPQWMEISDCEGNDEL
jgi:hypothetical protein